MLIKRTIQSVGKLLPNNSNLNQFTKRNVNLSSISTKLLSNNPKLFENVKRNVNLVPIGKFSIYNSNYFYFKFICLI